MSSFPANTNLAMLWQICDKILFFLKLRSPLLVYSRDKMLFLLFILICGEIAFCLHMGKESDLFLHFVSPPLPPHGCSCFWSVIQVFKYITLACSCGSLTWTSINLVQSRLFTLSTLASRLKHIKIIIIQSHFISQWWLIYCRSLKSATIQAHGIQVWTVSHTPCKWFICKLPINMGQGAEMNVINGSMLLIMLLHIGWE